jgi:60 kDa SS-A/Ro ribonucleoprotein
MVASIARRLADKKEIARSKTLPYQLLTTLQATTSLPAAIREALSTALEVATRNVPALDAFGTAYVCVDVSGSMASPVTGARRGATTVTRCIDVAALVGASVLRRSFDAELLPFEHQVVELKLDPDASIEKNARRLAAVGGGGTSCSAPLARLNERRAQGGLVLYVSDNESWCDARAGSGHGRGTEMLAQWDLFKRRNPHAKLVCIDLQPNLTTQAHERGDILNVGGFSDAVFDVIAAFLRSGPGPRTWVQAIAATAL